jgi:hypothetical protein
MSREMRRNASKCENAARSRVFTPPRASSPTAETRAMMLAARVAARARRRRVRARARRDDGIAAATSTRFRRRAARARRDDARDARRGRDRRRAGARFVARERADDDAGDRGGTGTARRRGTLIRADEGERGGRDGDARARERR